MSEKSYIGSVGSTGAQFVEAPVKTGKTTGTTKAVKGEDLRSGK